MIPLWAFGLLKSKWTWIAVGCLAAISVVGVVVHNFGVERYNEGVLNERVVWQTLMDEAVTERNRLNAQLRQLMVERDQASADLRAARAANLNQVREEIHNAETIDDIYNLYSAHHNSVRDEADANLARARADYLSSLSPGNDRSPKPIRQDDRVADVARGSRVREFEGIVVGYGLGQR